MSKNGAHPTSADRVRPKTLTGVPNQHTREAPRVLTKVRTHPAPNPLPHTWLRAIANSITLAFRETGWRKYRTSRAIHPTGNPRTGNDRITSGVARSPLLSNTEVTSATKYVAGSVSPDEHQQLNLPPLLWELKELDAMQALNHRLDLHTPLDNLMRPHRRDLPFRERLNRHGNPVMSASDMSTIEEREAVQLIAAAATIVTMDEADYWEWFAHDLDGAAALKVLEQLA